MERIFYLRKGHRNIAIRCLLFFVFIGTLSVYVSLVDAPKDRAIYAVLLFGLFWGLWACAATVMLLLYWFGSLSIKNGELCQRGLFSKSVIDLASVKDARWLERAGITMRTPSDYVTINFGNFEPSEALWLIRLFRSRLSESAQTNWPMFAYKVAVPLRDRMTFGNHPIGPGEFLITRRRWDWYFIPLILLSGVFGIIASSILQQKQLLAAPLGPIFLWLTVRFMTPRRGLRASRIGSDPKRGFFYFLLVWSSIGVAGTWAFSIAKLPVPLATYLAAVGSVVWFAGLLFVAHRYDREKRRRDLENAELVEQQWDVGEQSGAGVASDGGSGEQAQ